MIDLSIQSESRQKNIQLARERQIFLPTFEMMRHPEHLPQPMRDGLKNVGLWDINPLNLARISWRNEPVDKGGGFGNVNFLEVPPAITGVKARIFVLVGKWFPTGAHKVGATYGCLVPRLVTGQFDATTDKAVWPSTGNYCRGGAYNSALLGCGSIAILPEGMSAERFDWLKTVAGEIIATYGTESNVKEIFDKVNELRATRDDVFIFDQFSELGNPLWHYEVTGSAILDALEQVMQPGDNFAGFTSATGSSGTIGAGDKLKEVFPHSKIGASEALQCPTLLYNGFGEHRIEGIGDKHIPWIHNVKNTDMAIGVDDNATIHLMRLFNESVGQEYLLKQGLDEDFLPQLKLFGISGIGNMLAAVKMAKYYELTENDILFTINTDSMEMYQSRLAEETERHGKYTAEDAVADYHRYILATDIQHVQELSYYDRKRIHNLKYYTWIEQQGKSVEELNAQWYDRDYWTGLHAQAAEIDALIHQFNAEVGLYGG